jgi:hypothetical protein
MKTKLTNNKIFYLLFTIIFLGLQTSMISAQFYQIDYNSTFSKTSVSPNLVVQVLKYEPYPVNAGDWFTLWIKVQNIGQENAKDVKFEIVPDYPFSSTDNLIKNYGTIFGIIDAYNVDQTYDSSQVIMKFRIKVADNAPEGQSILKIKASIKNSESGIIYSLPIEIGKTKTDFDVVMQDSTTQGTSFAIANIGENPASALTVNIKPQSNIKIKGAQSSIIGNLEKGDFTTVTFPISPSSSLNEITIQISYTDTAGVRNTIEKIVPVSISSDFGQATTKSTSSSSSKYLYLIIGIVLGVLAVFIFKKIKKKK